MKSSGSPRWARALALALCSGIFGVTDALAASSGQIEWALGGQGFGNDRNQPDQTKLSPSNASQLAVKWTAQLHGDVSSTPAVTGGVVYVTDWGLQSFGVPSGGGYLTALNESNGAIIWSKHLADYAGETPNAVSRTSPAVVNGVIYIGDQTGHVLAIDAKTGNLMWLTNIDTQPGGLPLVSQSPMVYNGKVFVGTGSGQEGASTVPVVCCTHRGTFSALNATTGAILWTFYTEPPNSGPPPQNAGGGVWGSTPAVDPASGTVYIGTGNDYSTTPAVQSCYENVLNGSGPPGGILACLDPGDHHDSIIALDMNTGQPKWITGPQQLWDSWNVDCLVGLTQCPADAGPDYDFATGPQLLTATDAVTGKKYSALGIGEKSGKYWLLDASTGAVKWVRQVAGGSSLGGIEWGASTDGSRIYVASSDNDNTFSTIFPTPLPGRFTALDASSGSVIWDLVDPKSTHLHLGPTSVSNGVMFAGSMDGTMYALNAATGQILWSFAGQGASNAGPAIGLDGTVYWGNGYSHFGLGAGSTTFYAFSVNGK